MTYRDKFIQAKDKVRHLETVRNILIESVNRIQDQRIALFRTEATDYDAIIDREVNLRRLQTAEVNLMEELSALQIETAEARLEAEEALLLAVKEKEESEQ